MVEIPSLEHLGEADLRLPGVSIWVRSFEPRDLISDESWLYLNISIESRRISHGEPSGFFVLADDITIQRGDISVFARQLEDLLKFHASEVRLEPMENEFNIIITRSPQDPERFGCGIFVDMYAHGSQHTCGIKIKKADIERLIASCRAILDRMRGGRK